MRDLAHVFPLPIQSLISSSPSVAPENPDSLTTEILSDHGLVVLQSNQSTTATEPNPVTVAHVDLIRDLVLDGDGEYLSLRSSLELAQSNAVSTVLARIEDGKLRAYVGFYLRPLGAGSFYIGGVAARPSVRGTGLVSRLLAREMLIVKFRQGRGTMFELRMFIDGQGAPPVKAHRLYRKLGFADVGPCTVRVGEAYRAAQAMRTVPAWTNHAFAVLLGEAA